MTESKEYWPSWRYGPNGEAQVFDSAAEVPDGWHDHPSKHKKSSEPEAKNSSPPKTSAPAAKTPAKPAAKKAGRPPKSAPLDL